MMVKRLLLVLFTAVLALGAASEVRMAFSSDGLDGSRCCCWPALCRCSVGWPSALWSPPSASWLISGEHPFTALPAPAAGLRQRSAVLMPVYNESVEETFGRVETMARAIAAAGGAG
jgi:membrane glycosyltransferase